MTRTHRIHRLALGFAVAFALLAGPAAAAPSHHTQSGSPAVPISAYNARWPREPADGPLPATTAAPAPPAPAGDHHLTLVWIAAGLAIAALCTGVATGVGHRPRARRRVTA